MNHEKQLNLSAVFSEERARLGPGRLNDNQKKALDQTIIRRAIRELLPRVLEKYKRSKPFDRHVTFSDDFIDRLADGIASVTSKSYGANSEPTVKLKPIRGRDVLVGQVTNRGEISAILRELFNEIKKHIPDAKFQAQIEDTELTLEPPTEPTGLDVVSISARTRSEALSIYDIPGAPDLEDTQEKTGARIDDLRVLWEKFAANRSVYGDRVIVHDTRLGRKYVARVGWGGALLVWHQFLYLMPEPEDLPYLMPARREDVESGESPVPVPDGLEIYEIASSEAS